MTERKISLITASYNAESTIARCIESILIQDYPFLEYIIVDGGSTDQTLHIIERYKDRIHMLISEKDQGVYDAMNKGIAIATGDIIGTLNADDFFASDKVLYEVAEIFNDDTVDILYGDLDYIKPDHTVTRKWRSKAYKHGLFNWGWMPPHPTFYCRKELFQKLGSYSLNYGTAADYELMVRFMHNRPMKSFYLNKVMIKMQRGGLSNNGPTIRLKAWANDLKAMKINGILWPFFTLILKPLRKVLQYL